MDSKLANDGQPAAEPNPIHQKLGEIFVEVAPNGTLTPDLAAIYVDELTKIKGEGKDKAILGIIDRFAGDPKTTDRLLGVVLHTSHDVSSDLLVEIFERAKPIIASLEDPKQRVDALNRLGRQYGLPQTQRVEAYDLAAAELSTIEDPELRFGGSLVLLSGLLYEGRVMDVDTKAELAGRLTDIVFKNADAQKDKAGSFAAYQKIYEHHRIPKETQQRAVVEINALIDQLETPKDAYEATSWLISHAKKNSKIRNNALDTMAFRIKNFPTPDERIPAAKDVYSTLFRGYWAHGSVDYQNENVSALMDESLSIVSNNAAKAGAPQVQMHTLDWLYDHARHDSKVTKESVVNRAMALIDRQPTLSEREQLVTYLLEECRPDHGKEGYYLRGTLKGAAIQKQDSLIDEIELRQSKAPEISPDAFLKMSAGYFPPSND